MPFSLSNDLFEILNTTLVLLNSISLQLYWGKHYICGTIQILGDTWDEILERRNIKFNHWKI